MPGKSAFVFGVASIVSLVVPLGAAPRDRGPAPANLPLDRMLIVLKRSPAQQAQLDQLLAEQQIKDSANYHRWLTPQEFGERFGPPEAAIQAVTIWLESHGFRIDEVAPGRGAISFSGTAGQMEEAFHAPIHKFAAAGREYWASTRDPEIPAPLGDTVAGIANLRGSFSQPLSVQAAHGPRPDYSLGWYFDALAPADWATIYNVNTLYQAGISGNGATIAVLGRSNIHVSDVTDFERTFGLPSNAPQVILNGPDPTDLGGNEELEAVIDNSWAAAVAYNATIKFVISASTNATDGALLSEQYVVNHNDTVGADVMTLSFGTCEANASPSLATLLGSLAEQAAGEGITFVAAAGDTGAAGCDATSEVAATGPQSVNAYSSSPYVTAVGGTQFNEAAGNGPYWSESDRGAGYLSVFSYIPEAVWNWSCSASTCNGGLQPNIMAGGGGASTLFPKPAWQTNVPGIPSDGARDVPDVALAASAEHDQYLLCVGGGCSATASTPDFSYVGGTSAAASAFGGLMALVREQTKSRQGSVNTVLYKMASGEEWSTCNGSIGVPPANCVFNDVIYGSNSVPGVTGYSAGAGYDLATGLGSVNADNLVMQWGLVDSPVASFSPQALTFQNQAMGTISAAQTVTVTNTGGAALTISNVAISGNSSLFQATNGCTTAVAPGATCTISVTFAPAAAGTVVAYLEVTDNAPGSPQSVTLIGDGVNAAAVSLSATSLTFGPTAVGGIGSTQSVTFTDTGKAPLTILSVAVSGANANQFSSKCACPGSLNPQASCTVSVTFTPAAAGSQTASLVIVDNAPSSPQTVALSASGLGQTTVSLSPQSLNFGSVNVGSPSTAQNVTLSNGTTAPFSISSISLSGTNASQFVKNSECGSSLNPGAICNISITFQPTAAGSMSAALGVSGGGSSQSVTLTGTAVGVPSVNISPSYLNFSPTAAGSSSAAQSLTVTNNGSAALTISNIALSGTNAIEFSLSNSCPGSLNPAASCKLSVSFKPTTSGSATASVVITDNAASGTTQSVSLSGTSTQPAASISPTSLSFGSISVGSSSAAQTVTLTNSGTAALAVSSVAITGTSDGQFTQTSTCVGSLAAAASCKISVTFKPSLAGSATAELVISDNAANATQTVSLTGTAAGASAPAAKLSATTLNFGTVTTGQASPAQTETLTNSGTAALTIKSIAITGTAANQFVESSACQSVNPTASCSVSVTFKPTSTGSKSATLTITDNATGGTQNISLSGVASAPPSASFSTTSLNFGSVAVESTSAAQKVTISNTSTAALTISNVAITGTNANQFALTSACPATLNAGANCAVSITFKPTSAGSKTATLVITDNAATTSQNIGLSGTTH